jgi:hypothetical protein
MKKKVLFLLGIAVVAVIRTMWKKPHGQRKSDLRDRVNNWENEGGYVLGVPPTRNGG